jgi:hypothetical protein
LKERTQSDGIPFAPTLALSKQDRVEDGGFTVASADVKRRTRHDVVVGVKKKMKKLESAIPPSTDGQPTRHSNFSKNLHSRQLGVGPGLSEFREEAAPTESEKQGLTRLVVRLWEDNNINRNGNNGLCSSKEL